ncbi:hypothetical protein F7725_018179 [Dissostichus mawsoni]|uniref:Uncharacterized protein n=1 Tax=Dissostichus mawsoni TaxID=36200 RepID=A0A7J5XQW7_DISMA|nr:hypothetical protein F7725_018179 [Dissostichus mawsoni]
MTCNDLSFKKQLSYLTANNDGQHTIFSVSREEINTLVVVVYTVLIYVSEIDKETNKGFTSMEGSVNEKRLEDYENISTAHSAVSPNPLNDDTDTSEDELEINYSQVNLKAKTQRAARDLINSDEEETQYSHIKI